MTLLAIDPGRSFKGEATIGYALFASTGTEVSRGTVSFEQLAFTLDIRGTGEYDFTGPWLSFDDYKIDEVVIEDFVNNTRSKGGQRNGTSECIGAVDYACFKAGVPFTRQPNTLLPVAKLHAGYVDTHKHLPHQDAAYLHGYEYLVRKGVLQPRGLAETMTTNQHEREQR